MADVPAELADYLDAVRDSLASYFAQGWNIGIVDLSRVCALQQSVFVDHALERTVAVDAENWVSIAEISLPRPVPSALPVQFDKRRQCWVVTDANPNLRLIGHWSGQIEQAQGAIGFGFLVKLLPSFVQVARFQGRYVLRDGYHRAFGLLSRGVQRVPALVREFPQFEDLGLPAGLFPQAVYLGNRPPTLMDYLDDTVSTEVSLPGSQRMILVSGMELDTLI